MSRLILKLKLSYHKLMGNIISGKYYKFFLYGIIAILVIPVMNIQPWISPPAWGKTILFRIIFSILIWFFAYLVISKRDGNNFLPYGKKLLQDKKNKVFWALWLIIAFAFLVLLSTIFSQDPSFSFWGSPQRAGGSLNLLLYILFSFLAFFVLKEKDWPKIWLTVFITGFLVSLVAILQRLQLFSSILIPQTDQAVSTMGSPIILGLYLTLLIFVSLAFAIKSTGWKKYFYIICFISFAVNIIFSGSRASALGFVVGLPFFVFLYPGNKSKKIKILKIITAGAFAICLLVLFWLGNSNLNLGRPINRIIGAAKPFFDLKNFSFKTLISDNRPSGWNVALNAVKEKPLLGFGLENFSIAFDKYYDPSFSDLTVISWWDRAHSFIFEIASTMGVPALLVYLAIFGVLFWQLEKIKFRDDCPEKPVIHGIQTALIAYFTSLLFGFDEYSTYIALFLLVSYSLFIILKYNPIVFDFKKEGFFGSPLWKSGINFGLFIFFIIFVWSAALKPLYINKEINLAVYYAVNENQCSKAVSEMEKNISKPSVLDAFFRLSYVDILASCAEKNPDSKLALNLRLRQILEEAGKIMPTYTRIWWFLANDLRFTIGNSDNYAKIGQNINLDEAKKELENSYEKAFALNPGRWTILRDWSSAEITTGDYQKAINRSQKCLSINPNSGECYWNEALAYISLGQVEKGELFKKISGQYGFVSDELIPLNAYVQAYAKALETKKTAAEKKPIYEKIALIYQRLIEHYNRFQFHASLAFVYKELGEYDKAGEEAMNVFGLNPGSISTIEAFISSLPKNQNYYTAMIRTYQDKLSELEKKEYDPQWKDQKILLESQYYGALAYLHAKTGNIDKAVEEALKTKGLNPTISEQVDIFIKSLK